MRYLIILLALAATVWAAYAWSEATPCLDSVQNCMRHYQ